MLSPAAIIYLFAEEFAKENRSLKKGARFFDWQKRLDTFEAASAAVGVTLALLVREGRIRLDVKRGLLRRRLMVTRTAEIPEKYGVVVRGLRSISPYKETELRNALFLSIPISPLPANALARYIIREDIGEADYGALHSSLELRHEKENLKRVLEEFKSDGELWELFLRELYKAMDMCRGKEGINLYTPLDMLEGKV
ncbi:hypothetical protein [Palaeococcus ferrophilus]|uniref:hypothetical protein n=1 Tax=Palaeococcus ferrophilus TaxID=83868 RepID=UPI0006962CC6|nr:hypothetical protein [Palaeococcus ferrophilus]